MLGVPQNFEFVILQHRLRLLILFLIFLSLLGNLRHKYSFNNDILWIELNLLPSGWSTVNVKVNRRVCLWLDAHENGHLIVVLIVHNTDLAGLRLKLKSSLHLDSVEADRDIREWNLAILRSLDWGITHFKFRFVVFLLVSLPYSIVIIAKEA